MVNIIDLIFGLWVKMTYIFRRDGIAVSRRVVQRIAQNKSVGFTLASFDCLRFWTTLITQIYARKTHADT